VERISGDGVMGRINDYFGGENGAFAEAGKMCRGIPLALPAHVETHSKTLGRSEIAYQLGWAFSFVLRKRQLMITDEDLWTIARNKIMYGDPQEFVNGFKKYETE